MADCMTDPRWQRTYGTFGEDPELIKEIFNHLIPGVQGSENGVTEDGVALTIKHFPGGGARENGFDPHYKQRTMERIPNTGKPSEISFTRIYSSGRKESGVYDAILCKTSKSKEQRAV